MFDLDNPETLITIEIKTNTDKTKVSELINLFWHNNKNNYQLINSNTFYSFVYDKTYKDFVDSYIESNY